MIRENKIKIKLQMLDNDISYKILFDIHVIVKKEYTQAILLEKSGILNSQTHINISYRLYMRIRLYINLKKVLFVHTML